MAGPVGMLVLDVLMAGCSMGLISEAWVAGLVPVKDKEWGDIHPELSLLIPFIKLAVDVQATY